MTKAAGVVKHLQADGASTVGTESDAQARSDVGELGRTERTGL